MSTLLKHPEALCNIARRIAVSAGDIILEYYDGVRSNEVMKKTDGTPATLADQDAEAFIVEELYKLLPDVPVVGEELYAAGDMPSIADKDGYFWLVDALDGTREFIRGGQDFTVNIALVHECKPVLGVVFAPVSGVLYAAHGDGTAIRWNAETDTEKRISVRPEPKSGLVVARSKGHGYDTKVESFLEQFKVKKHVRMGSSLKTSLIAEGKADMYPRFGPTCLWDTAAAHAVLVGAGGYVTTFDGEELYYSSDAKNMLNPPFVASSFIWWNEE